MRHRLFRLSSTLSLLLCVAAFAFWIRSYRQADHLLLRPSPGRAFSAISDNGAVQWKTVRYVRPSLFIDTRPRFELNSVPVSDTELDAPPGSSDLRVNDPLPYEEFSPDNFVILRHFAAASSTGVYAGPRADPSGPDYRYAYLVTPHWSLVLVFAALPVARAVRRRRLRRSHQKNSGDQG